MLINLASSEYSWDWYELWDKPYIFRIQLDAVPFSQVLSSCVNKQGAKIFKLWASRLRSTSENVCFHTAVNYIMQ